MKPNDGRRNASGAFDPTAYEAIKRADKSIAGARARAEGEYFEQMIDAACELYQSRGIAIIEKTPEPMKPLGAKNRNGQFLACYTKAAQPDYKGTIRGGRALVMEAKHTDADKIDRSRVTPQQMDALEIHHRLGALAFVVVSFELIRFYRVPWIVWRDMRALFGRKYVRPDEIEQFKLSSPAGYVKFLDGIIGLNDTMEPFITGDICTGCGAYIPGSTIVCPNCKKEITERMGEQK